MTNTMNQVKAVELNTAIVDELKAVLGIMTRYNETEDGTEAIEAGYGRALTCGVCNLMGFIAANKFSEDDTYYLDRIVQPFVSYWKENLANSNECEPYYPVSLPGHKGKELYYSTYYKWLGEYGKRRLFFLQSLIVFLSERAHKWHIETNECVGGTFVEFIPFYTAEELDNL